MENPIFMDSCAEVIIRQRVGSNCNKLEGIYQGLFFQILLVFQMKSKDPLERGSCDLLSAEIVRDFFYDLLQDIKAEGQSDNFAVTVDFLISFCLRCSTCQDAIFVVLSSEVWQDQILSPGDSIRPYLPEQPASPPVFVTLPSHLSDNSIELLERNCPGINKKASVILM